MNNDDEAKKYVDLLIRALAVTLAVWRSNDQGGDAIGLARGYEGYIRGQGDTRGERK